MAETIKKKKVSDYPEATDTAGFWIFGSKTVGGVVTSVKFAFDNIKYLFGVTQETGQSETLAPSQNLFTSHATDTSKHIRPLPEGGVDEVSDSGSEGVYMDENYVYLVTYKSSIIASSKRTYQLRIMPENGTMEIRSKAGNQVDWPEWTSVYVSKTDLPNELSAYSKKVDIYGHSLNSIIKIGYVYNTSTGEFVSSPNYDCTSLVDVCDKLYFKGAATPYIVVCFGDDDAFLGTASINKNVLGYYESSLIAGTKQCAINFVKSQNTNGYDDVNAMVFSSKVLVGYDEYSAFEKEITTKVPTKIIDIIRYNYVFATNDGKPYSSSIYDCIGKLKASNFCIIENADIAGVSCYDENDTFLGASFYTAISKGISKCILLPGTESVAVNFAKANNPDGYDNAIVYTDRKLAYMEQVSQMQDAYLMERDGKNEVICCDGDSLTQNPDYTNELKRLLGYKFTVINNGVGGEKSSTISARVGGLPFKTTQEFTIPASVTAVDIYFQSLDGRVVTPLLQADGNVNPCYIQGIKGTMSISNGQYRFTRAIAGEERKVVVNSVITTNAMTKYRNATHIIFIGQNGGWDNNIDTLIFQIKKMVDFLKNKNYIVLSSHINASDELEAAFLSEFGARYVNLRQYMVNYGLDDAGISPTQEDLDAIAINKCPPSLLADAIHFNTMGYKLRAGLEYKKMVELGMI